MPWTRSGASLFFEMSVLKSITLGIENGREQFDIIMRRPSNASLFQFVENHVYDTKAVKSELVLGDNIDYMKRLIQNGNSEKFKLVYIDPPFFTKSKYNATINVVDTEGKTRKIHHLAYDDRFERNLEYYIENMTVRLLLIKELLADDGLLWIHLDGHSSHYIKVVMDELFGENHFINEIIWSYKSGGSAKKHFSKKHDTILLYSKTDNYKLSVPDEKSYNRQYKPYRFKGVQEYKDDIGWYTMVNMKDVWNIDMVGRTSKERTGYATQKPLELMNRIIDSSTEPGDMVADFFCGSGSFLEAAEKKGRIWFACDCEELATAMAKKRLDLLESNYTYRTDTEQPLHMGRVGIEYNNIDQLENGKKLYDIGIKDFVPEIDTGYIQYNDRKYVEDALTINTIQFIDYVMIDPDYRDEFSCEIVVDKDFNNMRFISPGNAAIIVVDVLGKEYFVKI